MRVLVITGAGISAESGIPTFRGKEGYWRNLDPAKLATPEAFARNPQLVWEWYNERRTGIRSATPNAAHEAIVRLAQSASEFLLVTQNVDDLHARAGLPREKIVQIHGNIFVTRCSLCGFHQLDDTDYELDRKFRSSFEIPSCPNCKALLRPGVVWFGEQLDPANIEMVETFLAREPCDPVLVVGTTALFGYIVDWAIRATGRNGRLIEVNPNETGLSRFATECIRKPAAVALPKLVSDIANQSNDGGPAGVRRRVSI